MITRHTKKAVSIAKVLRKKNWTWDDIALELTKQKLHAPRGGQWSYGTIRRAVESVDKEVSSKVAATVATLKAPAEAADASQQLITMAIKALRDKTLVPAERAKFATRVLKGVK